MLLHAKTGRRGLGDDFEHVAEIRRVVIAAAGSDVGELEIIVAEQMFRPVNADVGEIAAEGHLSALLKQP